MDGEQDWVKELKMQILRRQDPWVVLEGKDAVEAAVASWWDLSGILAGDGCEWEPPEWSGLELIRRPIEILEEISSDFAHQGVLGLAKQPDETADVAGLMGELEEDALVVICPRISDEAQAGAILRNAAALGAKAVIFGKEGVSPFERLAVRASSGAVFRVPVRVADGGQILRCLKMGGFQMIGRVVGEGAGSPSSLKLDPGRHALVVGSEDEGLGSFWKAACDSLVQIPAEQGLDPLDPSAASAVLLWELARRREELVESEE
ncbi:TrmH family RNA methyltransferase [Haloferula sp.]|uniref:TrmH family RNA methyltransferase n=1 Tax=Haloferula sp. TaxID=2497595 RepID=UPI00329D830F